MLEKFERSALMMVLSERTEMNGLLSLAKMLREFVTVSQFRSQ